MAKKAAYLIVQAINLFKDEPSAVREQAPNVIMSHVQQMMNGERTTIEGAGLVTEIQEAGPEDPINTQSD